MHTIKRTVEMSKGYTVPWQMSLRHSSVTQGCGSRCFKDEHERQSRSLLQHTESSAYSRIRVLHTNPKQMSEFSQKAASVYCKFGFGNTFNRDVKFYSETKKKRT